jgi:hypothetical protein
MPPPGYVEQKKGHILGFLKLTLTGRIFIPGIIPAVSAEEGTTDRVGRSDPAVVRSWPEPVIEPAFPLHDQTLRFGRAEDGIKRKQMQNPSLFQVCKKYIASLK